MKHYQVAHTIHYFQSNRKTVTMYPIRGDLINRRVWTDNTVELRLPSRRCVCVRACVRAGSTKGPRRGGGGRGGGWLKRRRLVKRNRPSRLNIRGTHGGLLGFCRTSLEIEREREGGGREGRWIYARSGSTKVQSSFRLTAYLIKTTLSPCTPLRFETSPSTSVRGDETSERKRKICTLLNLDCISNRLPPLVAPS